MLSEPIFEDIWDLYEFWRLKELHLKGDNILCQLCELESSADRYLNEIGVEGLYEGLMARGQRSRLEPGNYWTHLIAYDRHEYFPKEAKGYFYDAGEAYAHSAGKETFAGSNLYSFLEGIDPKLKSAEILEQLTKSELTQSFISKTSVEGLKWYEIAPLFFHLKDDIRKVNGVLSKSILIKHTQELKKEFPNSFPFVVTLLGLFFGYHYLYDAYYDKLGLKFYIQKQEDSACAVEEFQSEAKSSSTIEFDQDFYEEVINSIRCEKGRKGKKSIRKLCEDRGKSFELYKDRLEKDRRIIIEKLSYVLQYENCIPFPPDHSEKN